MKRVIGLSGGGVPLLRAFGIVFLAPLLSLGIAWEAGRVAARANAAAAQANETLSAVRHKARPVVPPEVATRLLLHGPTIGVAGADFHSLVSELSSLSETALDRIDQVSTEAVGATIRMRSTAVFTGPDSAIMSLILNLEAAEPLIFVDSLNLSSTDASGAIVRAELALSTYAIMETQ